jgi:eukaryotic-like serine/threonine-protein kinase
MIGLNAGLDPSGQILMGRTNDQMATKDDQPPNSGLWGHVQVEALPNPGSLPPPPPEAAPIQRGTLMGFALPPSVTNANATQPGPVRRTPNSGTAPVRSNSKTLTSGVVPQPNLESTVVPSTSPIGAIPKDTMLAPGGEPQPRGYYHASQATRTLIGGSVPAPSNVSGPTAAAGKRATAPGFPTLPNAAGLDKSTLVGVAMSPGLAERLTAGASDHPTHRSPPTDGGVSTERDLRAVVLPSGAPAGPAQPSAPPFVGTTSHLGRFRIQKRLGAGGVGAVYLASKVDASGTGNQLLAVKVLREHFYRDPSTLKALFREARLAARMDHRHIVRVFDIGYHNKHPYLVMEYVDGLSLTTLLSHGADLPLGVGIRCLIDALHGLDFAHKLRGDEGEPLGLVHCDVSPQNILIGIDGVAKVTDFGVARTREEDGDEFVLRCKPEFSAPELLQEEPVRPETDVFSAGAVLYRIATGRLPFPGETEDEIVESLLNSEPQPPSQVKEGLPPFLDAFCAQAMSKAVGDRFRTCLDMARSLERQAEAAGLLADRLTVGTWVKNVRRAMERGDVTPAPARRSLPPVEEEASGAPTRREPRNNKTVLVGAALATLLLAGLFIWWWMSRNGAQPTVERSGVEASHAPTQAPAQVAPSVSPLQPAPIRAQLPSPSASSLAPVSGVTAPTSAAAQAVPNPALAANRVAPSPAPTPPISTGSRLASPATIPAVPRPFTSGAVNARPAPAVIQPQSIPKPNVATSPAQSAFSAPKPPAGAPSASPAVPSAAESPAVGPRGF